MKKKAMIVSGQSKALHEADKPDTLIQGFRDDYTASTGRTRKIPGRAQSNNQISIHLFEYLESFHVPTHFIKRIDSKSMLVKWLEMIPVLVKVRNLATGSLCKKFKFKEGTVLDYPVIEHYLKTGAKDEPFVNDFHIYALNHSNPKEMKTIERMASKINALLKSYFQRRNLQLVDFTIEFGRYKGKLLLGDEISADTCALWDLSSKAKYSHNYLSKESKEVEKVYKYLLGRIVKGKE